MLAARLPSQHSNQRTGISTASVDGRDIQLASKATAHFGKSNTVKSITLLVFRLLSSNTLT